MSQATKIAEKTKGAILVITEGVFGMSGNQGSLKQIVDLKQKYTFSCNSFNCCTYFLGSFF